MMKKIIRVLSLASMALFAVSCSNESDLENANNADRVKNISASIEDFVMDGLQSRSAYTVSDAYGFQATWENGDVLGIYPIGGDQVAFPISSGEGTTHANFDGGSWALRSNYEYAAYYPFSSANYTKSQTAIPVKYINDGGQGENGSLYHLASHDYMAAAAVKPDKSGNVNLQMKHLGAFVKMEFDVPSGYNYGIEIISNNAEFTTAGTVDLTKEQPSITPTSTSSSVYHSTGFDVENGKLVAYMMVAPVDMSNSRLKFKIKCQSETKEFECFGYNFKAGYAYLFPKKFAATESGEKEYVDLGLPSGTKWAKCNIGASKPEDIGKYFAWGETTPKEVYEWSTYKWSMGTATSLTRYVDESNNLWGNQGYNGFFDDLFTLEPEDDAATINWGSSWRMPTPAECKELLTNCTWTRTILDNGAGYAFTVTGPNGNTILLPCGDYKGKSDDADDGDGFHRVEYWSNSIYDQTDFDDGGSYISYFPDNYASSLLVSEGALIGMFGMPDRCIHIPRCIGMPIRPVRK